MKLYYYRAPYGNFGDDLNPWLWARLLPGFFDDDEGELFVGIGTLLNHRLPKGPIKHVFGSGYGYGTPPRIDHEFVIHAVRGFETARVLGIDPKLVITDAAVLLRAVAIPRAQTVDFRIGFIPHAQSSRYFGWDKVCAELGFHYINAEWDVERVLMEMSRCETLVCEAMHGAIAADTMRIPWIPVTCYEYISEFKWRDWLSTLKLPYEPHRITSLYDIERHASLRSRIRNVAKRGLRASGVWSDNWTPPPAARTGAREMRQAISELGEAAKGTYRLSSDGLLNEHVERYLSLLARFREARSRTGS